MPTLMMLLPCLPQRANVYAAFIICQDARFVMLRYYARYA